MNWHGDSLVTQPSRQFELHERPHALPEEREWKIEVRLQCIAEGSDEIR
jgi:hypothetical protein